MPEHGPLRNSTAWLFMNELRMLYRDRRTILVSLVLPALMMPVLLGGSRWVEEKRTASLEADSSTVALSADAPDSVEAFVEAVISEHCAGRIAILGDAPHPLDLLDSGVVQAFVEVSAGRRPPPLVTIHYRADQERSRNSARMLEASFASARDSVRLAIEREHGISWVPDSVFTRVIDTSSPGAASGAGIGRFAMLFTMMFLLSGVSVAALDSIAGDRERGSLETLLASGVDRSRIARAKLAAAGFVGLSTVFVQILDTILIARLGLFSLGGVGRSLGEPSLYAALFLPIVSAALLAASFVLFISASSSTFREAQIKMFPALLAGIVPSLVTFFPGVEARSAFMAVPVSGAALAMRDALAGRPDLLCLAVSSMSMLAAAAVLSRATGRILSREEILATPPPLEPCPGALAKKAPLYFALLWTVSVISSFQLESVADIDTVMIVNQFVLLLAPSVFLAIRFRLLPSGVLRLKPPSPAAALIALPCAAAGALLAIDIHSAVSLLLPESGRALEEFSRFLLPGGTGILKALVLMCLVPGIVEEFAFRGVLMGTLELRHGFGRIRSLLLAALFFGAFHFLYFRIVPTAFIGILTGIAVIRSGSVFTGMIWHAAGNAAALLAAMNGLDPAALPLPAHLAAPVLIAAGLLLMGRKRRVSPGGRPSRSGSI